MNYWLVKSEEDCYSVSDWEEDKETQWTGVRNYQVRNFMQAMKVGDKVIFYHSGGITPHAAGCGLVSREASPDLTALDPKDDHYDPKSTRDKPIWQGVYIKHQKTFLKPINLAQMRQEKSLAGMVLLQKGSRLSVQPVTGQQYEKVVSLGTLG